MLYKIQKRIKEYKDDIKKGNVSMALARLNAKESVEIDFQHTKKLANYKNFSYALKIEEVEIITECKAIIPIEHALVEQGW